MIKALNPGHGPKQGLVPAYPMLWQKPDHFLEMTLLAF